MSDKVQARLYDDEKHARFVAAVRVPGAADVVLFEGVTYVSDGQFDGEAVPFRRAKVYAATEDDRTSPDQ